MVAHHVRGVSDGRVSMKSGLEGRNNGFVLPTIVHTNMTSQ